MDNRRGVPMKLDVTAELPAGAGHALRKLRLSRGHLLPRPAPRGLTCRALTSVADPLDAPEGAGTVGQTTRNTSITGNVNTRSALFSPES